MFLGHFRTLQIIINIPGRIQNMSNMVYVATKIFGQRKKLQVTEHESRGYYLTKLYTTLYQQLS